MRKTIFSLKKRGVIRVFFSFFREGTSFLSSRNWNEILFIQKRGRIIFFLTSHSGKKGNGSLLSQGRMNKSTVFLAFFQEKFLLVLIFTINFLQFAHLKSEIWILRAKIRVRYKFWLHIPTQWLKEHLIRNCVQFSRIKSSWTWILKLNYSNWVIHKTVIPIVCSIFL